MAQQNVENGIGRGLATGLGIFSVGLGVAEIVAPKKLSGLIGIERSRSWVLRSFGAREIAAGSALLGQSRPLAAMWSRLAGDAVDLAALGLALRRRRNNHRRTAAALAAVAGVTALDVVGAILLSRPKATVQKAPLPSFIINKPREQCFAFLRDNTFQLSPRVGDVIDVISDRRLTFRLGEQDATVIFEDAPRQRTKVSIDVRKEREILRRFKQLIETGEIPTTTGQSEGKRSVVGKFVRQVES